MRRWLVRIVLLVGVVGLGLWAWRALFPNPEKVIRARLAELAKTASFGPNEAPAATLWNAQKLAAMFTTDVTIKIDQPEQQRSASGREAIQNTAMGLRQYCNFFSVQFNDLVITLAPDKQSAIAELTACARAGGNTDTFGPHELSLRMKKENGQWYVSRVETVRTLR
jgi:hypothetical protein